MSSLYEYLLQQQSPESKQQANTGEAPKKKAKHSPDGKQQGEPRKCELQSPDGKCMREEDTPRYKLKLQRHVSDASSVCPEDTNGTKTPVMVPANLTPPMGDGKTCAFSGKP
jgi:hypothetical protein